MTFSIRLDPICVRSADQPPPRIHFPVPPATLVLYRDDKGANFVIARPRKDGDYQMESGCALPVDGAD